MTIFFTSDSHLGHKNIIKYSNRPFASVEEMDNIIIANYNSVVKEGDTVYDLGDFSFTNPKKYLDQLNVLPIRIKGSHDHDLKESSSPRMLVIKPNNLVDEYGEQISITLCHYAMRSWEKSHYGSWCLWGHHHGMLEPYGLSFDCGTDTNNFYPYSLEDVTKKMKTLFPIIDFRK
jgi:calcineurin-like phosphoesterase family protein